VTFARPFEVGRDAVTRGQFAAFVNATGHKTSDRWRNPGFQQNDSHPVVCIRWEDAKAYAAWLASITGKPYRLLSEAEWEYAARASTSTPFWWGSSITPAQANYNGNVVYEGGGSKGEYRGGTVPVGSFDPNPWGLYNVHGNVWGWCEDTWHDT
jgi:formylglycine-generating enzyme required for sulfatase activity